MNFSIIYEDTSNYIIPVALSCWHEWKSLIEESTEGAERHGEAPIQLTGTQP